VTISLLRLLGSPIISGVYDSGNNKVDIRRVLSATPRFQVFNYRFNYTDLLITTLSRNVTVLEAYYLEVPKSQNIQFKLSSFSVFSKESILIISFVGISFLLCCSCFCYSSVAVRERNKATLYLKANRLRYFTTKKCHLKVVVDSTKDKDRRESVRKGKSAFFFLSANEICLHRTIIFLIDLHPFCYSH
jgi:hypothetical protein